MKSFPRILATPNVSASAGKPPRSAVVRQGLARGVTVAFLALLVAVLLLRDRAETISASDKDTTTWGAIDPTWSPDGEFLAFSLFGSIWRVPAAGGNAEQISTSGRYHAHPVWSPRGDEIAFIRGASPRGPMPYIRGSLFVVNVETGREREIKLDYPTAGKPSWSPDGKKIVCGLSVPDAGSLLHAIDLADGAATRLHERPQRGPAGRWTNSAWSPKPEELFFGGQRVGAPQIWLMPSSRKGIMTQLSLSRYQPEDIVFLDSLSAMPDGSGVVYSAVEVNGRGNYELYRVSRKGGEVEPLTKSTRDEFAPAVSPDGSLVAHVSNHLGNIDVFTMPIEGGDKKHVQISGLTFRHSAGQVRVKVLDELGNPTPVRLYVKAADGKAYCPRGEQVFYYPLEPGGPREGFFIASGDDTFTVPAGRLQLTALKGIEYRIADRRVNISADHATEITIQMERWTNWAQRGWYTGENHFHANYNGNYYQRPNQSLAWLKAEDLNAANMIVANAAGAFVHDKEFFTGDVSPVSTDRYVLYWGQEYRNSDPLGHMGFLNIKELVPPFYTSVIGSDSPYDFPLNTMTAQKAKAQGGLVTYMHPIHQRLNDVFDTNLGAKESVVTAALGALDMLDLLPYGEPTYHLWYRLLNCGFKIAAAAGTDAFTNWRGINRIPGGSRQYVHVGGRMNWDRWIEELSQGHSFATNAPLMTFTLNGQEMGEEIRVASGQPYRAKLVTEVSSRVPLRRVEFIHNGKVIEGRDLESNTRNVRLEKEVEVERSGWFAARVSGRPARGVPDAGIPQAHTSPVYVTFDGTPVLLREDLDAAIRWINRLWAYLVERDNFGPGDNRERAKAMIDQARQHYREKLARAW